MLQAAFEKHRPYLTDPLWQPEVDAYRLGESFLYEPRWTGVHFGIQRDIIRAMCLNASVELQDAWQAILKNGGPDSQPAALASLARLPDRPEPLNWRSALRFSKKPDRLDLMRDWTLFYRNSYAEVKQTIESEMTIRSSGVVE